MTLGTFEIEKREKEYAITYTDSLVPRFDFLLLKDLEKAEELKKLFSLAYTFGSSNALQVLR